MHACIAALSQYIPAVSIAYSKKFLGVYDTIGMSDLVIDVRNQDITMVIDRLKNIYCQRESYRADLARIIPEVKKTMFSILTGI
jgi:polysaccharide pyruvyl transferase WcaK-like protein